MIIGKAEVFMITKDGKIYIPNAYIGSLDIKQGYHDVTAFGGQHREFVESSGEGTMELTFSLDGFHFEKNGKNVSESVISAARLPRKMDIK